MGSSSSAINTQTKNSLVTNGHMEQKLPETDARLPFTHFRELFTLKNFWKTIKRNKESCGKTLLYKMLCNKDVHSKFIKLNHLNMEDEGKTLSDPEFEKLADKYITFFDDVIALVEQSPGDVHEACNLLESMGKVHKKVPNIDSGSFQQLEEPFLQMVRITLDDRFNDKAESLFRKFFQFCLIYVTSGYNS